MQLQSSAWSDRGLQRTGNEDQFLIDESLGLYVVCDGMGGHAAGEIAAERAIEYAADHLRRNAALLDVAQDSPDGYFRVLKLAEAAVQNASQKVFQLAATQPELAGMGTTMTALVVIDDKAVMAHVGDSRLYLLRSGELHQLSTDHTLANEMYLTGGLTAREAASSRYQHVLTRSIGPHEFVTVDTLLFDLIPGDTCLICSDGLSNYFDDVTTVTDLLDCDSILEQPKRLVEYAKTAGGADNITALIVQAVADSEHPSPLITQTKIELLRSTFLCRKLSVSRLMHVLNVTSTIECAAGRELLAFGDSCDGLYVVLDGAISLETDDIVSGELEAGDTFGAAALATPIKSHGTLTATVASRVLYIERKKFDRLTRRLPRLGNALLRNLCRYLSEKIAESEAESRYSLDDTQPFR